MEKLTPATFRQPEDLTDKSDPSVLYVLSYLLIRTVVGVIGLVLPFILIIGETFYVRGGMHVRGSLSAYYHTSMRDLFVAGLCVTGVLLATYMSGLTKTWDFWLSLIAGIAVLGVVFFPTARPGLLPDAPRCGSTPIPEGCASVQQQFGETFVASIHFACATIFILCLAAIAFLFAYREKAFKNNIGMARIQKLCGWAIIVAVAVAVAVAFVVIGELLHLRMWELTPLYLASVAAVWAFGVS